MNAFVAAAPCRPSLHAHRAVDARRAPQPLVRRRAAPRAQLASPPPPPNYATRDLTFRTDVVSVDEEIRHMVESYPLVLFMKGTSMQPKCGFSRQALGILESIAGPQIRCVDCLNGADNPGLRDGVKLYSRWPTIPQLYINGEFVGGCDIVTELAHTGQLAEMIEVALA